MYIFIFITDTFPDANLDFRSSPIISCCCLEIRSVTFFGIFPRTTVVRIISCRSLAENSLKKDNAIEDIFNYLLTVVYLLDASFICSPAVAVNHVMSQAHRSALSDLDDRSEIQVGGHQGQGCAKYQRRKPRDLHLR